MLRLTPILLAIAYAIIAYRFSAWRTHRELDARSTELADPELKRLTDRLAASLEVARVPVFVYEIDPVNGLAAPDGRIFITRGFYRKYRSGEVSGEELASVIAHELGHVALGHSRRRMIDFSGQNAIRTVLMMVLGRFVPVIGPWLAGMVTSLLAARLSRGGFGDNLTTGLENYNKDIWAGRLSMEMGGYGEPVFLRISGDYTKDESDPRGGTRLIPGLASGAPVLDDVFDTRGGLDDPIQDVEAYGLAMNAEIMVSDTVTLRSISAWRKDDSLGPIDFDALPAVDLDVPGAYFNEQISQELQLLYDNGPLNGLLGFYYLDAKADTLFDVRIFTTFAGLTAFTRADVDTETYAIFGDLTYDIGDRLSVSLGGRYTWDERTADILRQNYLGGGSPFFGGAGIPFGAPSTNFQGSAKFEKFTPRASISFMPTPDHNLYASYSKGFKGGGFDPRGVGTNAPAAVPGQPTDAEIADFLSFAPEEVDSYEIGYKGSLMNGALNVAAAAFYADYTDVQIPGSVACTIQVNTGSERSPRRGLQSVGIARLYRCAIRRIYRQYRQHADRCRRIPRSSEHA